MHEELGLWTSRADQYQERFRAGEISYEEFCRLDALEWQGLSESRLRGICDRIPFHPGAKEMARALRGAGLRLGIVSTGLSILAERVRSELGFDHSSANHLEIRDGRLSGGIRIDVGHGGKDRAFLSFCRRYGLDAGAVAAVGDTEGDISMFRLSGWSIAFNPADDRVRASARVVVEGTDLRALIPGLCRAG